jgi:hypothetical protein
MRNIVKNKKHLSESPTHTITWIDQSGNMQTFKSSEKMLQSHKILMHNNPYVKEMKVRKGV